MPGLAYREARVALVLEQAGNAGALVAEDQGTALRQLGGRDVSPAMSAA